MPIIRMTDAEMEAILFFRAETSDKLAACEDQQYADDVDKHSETIEKLRYKYKSASDSEAVNKAIRKLIK